MQYVTVSEAHLRADSPRYLRPAVLKTLLATMAFMDQTGKTSGVSQTTIGQLAGVSREYVNRLQKQAHDAEALRVIARGRANAREYRCAAPGRTYARIPVRLLLVGALEHLTNRDLQVLVAVHLRSHNKSGAVMATSTELAQMLGMQTRHVSRALKHLFDYGYLTDCTERKMMIGEDCKCVRSHTLRVWLPRHWSEFTNTLSDHLLDRRHNPRESRAISHLSRGFSQVPGCEPYGNNGESPSSHSVHSSSHSVHNHKEDRQSFQTVNDCIASQTRGARVGETDPSPRSKFRPPSVAKPLPAVSGSPPLDNLRPRQERNHPPMYDDDELAPIGATVDFRPRNAVSDNSTTVRTVTMPTQSSWVRTPHQLAMQVLDRVRAQFPGWYFTDKELVVLRRWFAARRKNENWSVEQCLRAVSAYFDAIESWTHNKTAQKVTYRFMSWAAENQALFLPEPIVAQTNDRGRAVFG